MNTIQHNGNHGNYVCNLCNKPFKGKGSYAAHKVWCGKTKEEKSLISNFNPNRKPPKQKRLQTLFICDRCQRSFENRDSYAGHRSHCGKAQDISSRNGAIAKYNKERQGKTYEEIYGKEKADELKKRQSERLKGKPWKCKNIEDLKKKQSENRIRNVLLGKGNNGRGHQGIYKGMYFHSTWELALWLYCNDHGFALERNKQSFEYEYNGTKHRYIPDFEWNGILIELKGWETKQDLAKYSVVSNLIVIHAQDMKLVFAYVKKTYGDVSDLYETQSEKEKRKKVSQRRNHLWKLFHYRTKSRRPNNFLKSNESQVECSIRKITQELELLKSANIDMNKYGCIAKISKLWNTSHTHVRKVLRRNNIEHFERKHAEMGEQVDPQVSKTCA